MSKEYITIGSLFAGIGGLELGLERAGLGPVVWQVEKDAFCRTILEKHWPEADRSVVDVNKANQNNLTPVGLICGGFPCQGISATGKKRGLADPRSGLWYQFARILDELRPKWCVIENVSSGAKLWVEQVQNDLSTLGYSALPIELQARDVGYPHIRTRYFFLGCTRQCNMAHTAILRPTIQSQTWLHDQGPRRHHNDRCGDYAPPPARGDEAGWAAYVRSGGPEPGIFRGSDGFSSELDRARIGAIGNAVAPPMAEVFGWVIKGLMEELVCEE